MSDTGAAAGPEPEAAPAPATSPTPAPSPEPEPEPGSAAAPAADPSSRPSRTIALVAHDGKKADLLDWAQHNRDALASHHLVATGTTGALVADRLGLPVRRLESGPLGGDMQLGAMIADEAIDVLIFLWDPLSAQPHEPDVRALLRVATLWNVPVASNRATADLLITSPLLTDVTYTRRPPDHARRREQLRAAPCLPPAPTPARPDSRPPRLPPRPGDHR